jgi:hypothetical protein
MNIVEVHRELFTEMFDKRIKEGYVVLSEEKLTLEYSPYRYSNNILYGSFVLKKKDGSIRIESSGPMIGLENLVIFEEEEMRKKAYLHGIMGFVLKHLKSSLLSTYELKQFCL